MRRFFAPLFAVLTLVILMLFQNCGKIELSNGILPSAAAKRLYLTYPDDGSYVNEPTVFKGTCSSSGTLTFSGAIKNSPITSDCQQGEFSVLIDLTEGDGEKPLNLVEDVSGVQISQNYKFRRGPNPNNLGFLEPNSRFATKSQVNLILKCQSPYLLKVEGEFAESPLNLDCVEDLAETVVTLEGEDGNKPISISQPDGEGYVPYELTRPFVKDTKAPVLSVSSPLDNQSFRLGFIIEGQCEYPTNVVISGLIVNSQTQAACSEGGVFSTEVTFQGLDGEHELSIQQTDLAGNESEVLTFAYKKDTLGPVLNFNDPNILAPGETLGLTGTSSNIMGNCEGAAGSSHITINSTGNLVTAGAAFCSPINVFQLSVSYLEGMKVSGERIEISQSDSLGNQSTFYVNVNLLGNPVGMSQQASGFNSAVNHCVSFKNANGYTADLYCWGDNSNAQIDNNTLSGTLTLAPAKRPRKVVGLPDKQNITQIKTAATRICVVTGGSVYCNGSAWYGENETLGVFRLESGFEAGVSEISMNSTALCAVQNGSVKCKGVNTNYVLGKDLGELENNMSTAPLQIQGLEEGVIDIKMSSEHYCALKSDGTVYCWGSRYSKALGVDYSSETCDKETLEECPQLTALPVPGLPAIQELEVGAFLTCAVSTANSIYCWGNDVTYLGVSGEVGTPSIMFEDSSGINDLQIARESDGPILCYQSGSRLKCMGSNQNYIINNESPNFVQKPGMEVHELINVKNFSMTKFRMCINRQDGKVLCWGDYADGPSYLGNGREWGSKDPVQAWF